MDRFEHASGLPPTPTSALTLFEGDWSSALPEEAVGRARFPGPAALFSDDRIRWLLERLGSVGGWSALELGPLEGGHSYMLDRAGLSVTAIESNSHAYLRCLITKEVLGSRHIKTLYGDFVSYLETASTNGQRFDLLVASGVLYHMEDPLRLLDLASRVSDNLYLWTHYFEPDATRWAPAVRQRLPEKWSAVDVTLTSGALTARARQQYYLESREWDGFTGGAGPSSFWLHRDDLVDALGTLGYAEIEIAHEQPQHPNGPAFSILARKANVK